ncbi:MAG: 16S rRNA (guanine(966)-N(2))-methyltransferase RsmD [Helicobacter sp.]|nr:16S rRNA (guanine(966)-N(2))-methyltransferase RsmD [Helicobacter sp.]
MSKGLKNKATLRVIGGIFKGRVLKMPPLEVTRSSKSILKESLFNTIYDEVIGANFVEFFAGSGSIGIEALSRGAKAAFFFEKDKQSYKVLQENLMTICKECHYQVFFGDIFGNYQQLFNALDKDSISIGYFDPPFCIREGMEEIYQKCFKLIEELDSKVFELLILEHISSLTVPEKIGVFMLHKTKRFGKSALSYYR